MKKIMFIFLLAILGMPFVQANEPKRDVEQVYYLNQNRRPFSWYSPYPYEYYYQRRDGQDGCNWQYTDRGLEYTCP